MLEAASPTPWAEDGATLSLPSLPDSEDEAAQKRAARAKDFEILFR
jgi:hypothetical protein